MKKFMILFAVGRDRPGIVDDVSTLLFERGANIEESRMSVMGGCFSIMTLFSCSAEQLESIQVSLEESGKLGLETYLRPAEDPERVPVQAALPLKFRVTAMDHPGIVQKLVRVLRGYHINITNLNTQLTRAPLSGAPLFDLTLEADVPKDKPVAKVKEELLEVAAGMNLDLNFMK